MDLFLCERKGRPTDELIRLCLDSYDPEGLGDARIERSEKGKPYLAGDFGVHFSVSHSGSYWSCLVAGSECGLDIQIMKEVDEEALSERFFTDPEKEYVRKNGREGFYDIWVRKEAAAKCLATSLMSVISKISVADEDGLLSEAEACGRRLRFSSVDMPACGGCDLSATMKCAVCTDTDNMENISGWVWI